MKLSRNFLITGSVVVLAALAALILYGRYLDRPWTRDGQVQANIVGIAPRVAGPIIQIPIKDNQAVKKDDLLFEIDPSTFQAAVDQAAAQLKQTQAAALKSQQNLERTNQLFVTKVVDSETLQNAQDDYTGAVADMEAAQAALETAQLNLQYTKVYSPVDGYLTNMNTSLGTYVNAGEQLLALVDSSSFWVAAYFKETQLKHLAPGGKVKITLMGHAWEPFEGVVNSVGWGVFLENGSAVGNGLLPQVYQTIDWVRLPQRFAVRVDVAGKPPVPLRIGQTASIAVMKQ
ncbi:MAG TPA: HlyD family secretion protein [Chthoniobacterales bacterium]